MSSEHVEVLERLRGVLEHGKMGDKCLIAPDLVTAAIEALSAPQPPAEAQPERYACNGPEGTFWTDDAALANKLIGAAFDRDEWTVTDTQNPTGAAPPPSAPVWVEGAMVERAWEAAMEIKHNKEPWFPMTKRRMKRALSAALAQQPAAAGEDIMVNAAHDVYTLPLQPSGLLSGPRFVVHVPAPEQPAAHPAITHCDNCGCDWLDNGLNPIGCPYCKQNAWRSAYVAERATRYREGGMKIEQARIHAETDAARIAALAAQPGGSDNDR